MSIRNINKYPDPVLRRKTEKITTFDNKLKDLARDMADTMYDAPGVGLAAPQIGVSQQIIVVDVGKEGKDRDYMVLINPEITEKEGSQFDEEACLSVPDLVSGVKRFRRIKVVYQDVDGAELEIEAEDRFAVVLQHEIDHLHGVLFLDHLSSLKKNMYKKKMKKYLSQRNQG